MPPRRASRRAHHIHFERIRLRRNAPRYTVRAHETHHRYPTKNMAQYFMFWDKLYGTYKPYYDGADKAKKREKLAAEASERTVLKTGEHLKEKVR